MADGHIRGAYCGKSSHGDVVFGPLEIWAHVESCHHTYTHTEGYCENKTGDKGPSKTWTTDRCTLSELTWNTFLTSNRSEKETLITNEQFIWAAQGPNQSFSLLQEAEVGLYCVWQNKTRMEWGNMGFFLHLLDHHFIYLISNFIYTVFILGFFASENRKVISVMKVLYCRLGWDIMLTNFKPEQTTCTYQQIM